MTMEKTKSLTYLEWIALNTLYQHRDRTSSPVRYVGLPATVHALMEHQPPLVEWVGKRSDQQVHITAKGVAVWESSRAE